MRTWRRAPLVLASALALLLGAAACTGDPAPDPPDESPRPLPTRYEGTAPPGIGPRPVRFLHGPGGEGPDLLDDPMGVRVQSVGDAFLISSNSEDRHVLQRAADGGTLWEGDRQVERFSTAPDGGDALVLSEHTAKKDAEKQRTTTTVIDTGGETVWRGSDPRDTYLDGVVVRRPKGWSAEKPYGAFTVSAADGAELADFEFTEPPDEEAEEGAEEEPPGDVPAEDRFGVPVGAHGDVLFLADGAGRLQARDLADDGALLWEGSAADPDIAAAPQAAPRLVGFYDLPGDGPGTGTPSASGTPAEDGGGDPAARAVLVRWAGAEDPSVLSLHDLRSGDLLWSLAEPGANPSGAEISPGPVPGTIEDPATGTVLLPQGSGETPMIALDVAAGEIRWQFDDDAERALSPAFSLDGNLYGDTRGAEDGDSQTVLDTVTKDVVSDDLPGYVEAATDDGYALVIQDRQRFVFPPPGAPGETPATPGGTPGGTPGTTTGR
ncbi:hypothetical protein CLV63_103278 [Murinocardiopsis flavida]|uniref:Pyrroloquinoline-quinone binding quinoprotein n=1 Tax=Murinocardiopsis flavida TaxID=645275 RepID=A0A2P8DQQ9_9ACTN|nr:hypothetical protein [Murinocardiopsis flavida]PSK99553.1 hypothetical protein CLV63_103278 [Murinocardiopsis flavida]